LDLPENVNTASVTSNTFQDLSVPAVLGRVGLLTGFSLAPHSGWLTAAGVGILYGVVTIAVVVLSKGKDALGHAMFMIPSAAITGAVTGVLVGRYAF
jgi:hypothetical protein